MVRLSDSVWPLVLFWFENLIQKCSFQLNCNQHIRFTHLWWKPCELYYHNHKSLFVVPCTMWMQPVPQLNVGQVYLSPTYSSSNLSIHTISGPTVPTITWLRMWIRMNMDEIEHMDDNVDEDPSEAILSRRHCGTGDSLTWRSIWMRLKAWMKIWMRMWMRIRSNSLWETLGCWWLMAPQSAATKVCPV